MTDYFLKFPNQGQWLSLKANLPPGAAVDDIGVIRELIFDGGVAIGSSEILGYHVNVRCDAAIDDVFTAYQIVPANPVREWAK